MLPAFTATIELVRRLNPQHPWIKAERDRRFRAGEHLAR